MGMNKLSPERRAQVVRALVEGNSIRATCRMTDTAKGTVLRLLADVGQVCAGRVHWLARARVSMLYFAQNSSL